MRHGKGSQWIWRDFLCGCLIGAGAILPGVSGGVLAVIFGVYEPLMECISDPRRGLQQYGARFVPILLGMGIGFGIFAKGLLVFFQLSYTAVIWAFIGLILGTLPALFRNAGARGRGIRSWSSMAVCGLLMLAGLAYSSRVASVQITLDFWWYCFGGVLLGVGMMIPGMSTSGVLMAMGLYEPMLGALAVMEWRILLMYGICMILTIMLLARGVRWVFRKYYSAAHHGVIGIVVASALTLVPLEYHGVKEIVLSAICCLAGFALAFLMEQLDSEMKENRKER